MPITIDVRREHNLVILAHVGTVSDDKFLNFYRSLLEQDRINLSMNQLVDLRRADSTPRSPDVLRQIAEFVQAKLKGLSKGPKVAVVAPEDLSFGLARIYEVFSFYAKWDFKVFRAMDDALAWLNVPKDLLNGAATP